MYIASTRFKIIPGQEKKFEALWRQRESNLEFVDGFEKFNLLMGFKTGGFSMYASNTKWESKKSFDAWQETITFWEVDKNVGKNRSLYLTHPKFESFEIII